MATSDSQTPLRESTGSDVMVGSAASMGLTDQLERASRGSTINQNDIDRITHLVTELVKTRRAAGDSDEEIQRAAGQLAGANAELAHVAAEVAQKQLDPDKFNLFAADRNNTQQVDQRGYNLLDHITTTEYIASLVGGFVPDQGLPGGARDRGQTLTI